MRKTFGIVGVALVATMGCASQMQLGGVNSAISGSAGGADSATGAGPKCTKPLGPAALVEPDARVTTLLTRVGLQSPIPLMRLAMMQSNCFQVVDRGAAMGTVQQEERLRAGGMLRDGSESAHGQLVAARWLITPNVVFSEPNAGGSSAGGFIGGLFGGPLGALVGSAISTKVSEAQVVLFVTDAQTGVQTMAAEGSAKVRDFAGGAGLGGVGAGLVGFGGMGGYSNTNEGKLITAALLDAYSKLVDRLRLPSDRNGVGNASGDVGQTQAAAAPRVTDKSASPVVERTLVKGARYLPTATVNLRASPGTSAPILSQLKPTTLVTAVGEEHAGWWLVSTESARGWVLAKNLVLQATR